ncbi:MAG: zinc ribbon domain-containing protein [Clostridiales Family XIII bacterium]|uniref:Zinc ribbon domain-containing protein n=1 Tax=Hominibacterium faecale TaxID=2839743 RepID=A0A9J6QTW1_9FIRM|nr:zinc ribbon domain-containing protein [Hominibacterium faecale]MCI7304073.1 zinc ribbon domain-containing protein [Clostridia bacterium]MCU7379754.1 zinc ribbon domain-containing protein [Hominibacterium faecale]MDY3011723.1 zinc ribbon domain-containing protein [Clostridiales Family XIII bacterium]
MKFCPECGTKVEGMKFCPECGYKIETSAPTDMVCPEFPEDMSLGEKSSPSTAPVAEYMPNENDKTGLKNTPYIIYKFDNGLGIGTSFLNDKVIPLHKSQIIVIEEYSEQELKDKSVIGRGIVGLALGGPLGAVLGGMSGVGKKTKNQYYLLIQYWDVKNKRPQLLTFKSKKRFDDLIDYCQKNFK